MGDPARGPDERVARSVSRLAITLSQPASALPRISSAGAGDQASSASVAPVRFEHHSCDGLLDTGYDLTGTRVG
jgi:hypothetical protein